MFNFEIITPDQVFYSAKISSLVTPGMEGTFGVLTSHAPLLARSNGGRLKVRETNNQERFFEVGPGIVEVLGNRAVFFTKQAQPAAAETK